MSHDVVNWIATSSKPLRKLTDEDSALGVWLSSLESVRPVHDESFAWSYRSRFARDYNYNWTADPMKYLILKDVEVDQWIEKWSILVSLQKTFS